MRIRKNRWRVQLLTEQMAQLRELLRESNNPSTAPSQPKWYRENEGLNLRIAQHVEMAVVRERQRVDGNMDAIRNVGMSPVPLGDPRDWELRHQLQTMLDPAPIVRPCHDSPMFEVVKALTGSQIARFADESEAFEYAGTIAANVYDTVARTEQEMTADD